MPGKNDHQVRIDKGYLTEFQTFIRSLVQDLKYRVGTPGQSLGEWLPKVDASLKVFGGGTSFTPAANLNAALNSVGGSIANQLSWLTKLFNDLDSEITTTLSSFEKNETLNTDTIEQFLKLFPDSVTDVNSKT